MDYFPRLHLGPVLLGLSKPLPTIIESFSNVFYEYQDSSRSHYLDLSLCWNSVLAPLHHFSEQFIKFLFTYIDMTYLFLYNNSCSNHVNQYPKNTTKLLRLLWSHIASWKARSQNYVLNTGLGEGCNYDIYRN